MSILVTGGLGRNNDDPEKTAEVITSQGTSKTCNIPDLPFRYAFHTQSDQTVCGGNFDGTTGSCYTLENGGWTQSYNLLDNGGTERTHLVSWKQNNQNVLLMGGAEDNAKSTTQRLQPRLPGSGLGDVQNDFPLRYPANE